MVFSATKGMASTVIHRLADRGLIDYEAPVAEYWHSFGANGKAATTVRMLFSHQAGLVALDRDLSFEEVLDWDPVVRAIELANLSQAVLPRFGSVEYKDARAPNNLYPIAGLERELRRRLGDARVLYRSLRQATTTV